MMDFVELPLSAFGFSVQMSASMREHLRAAETAYRKAREQYEVFLLEHEEDSIELSDECDRCRRKLAEEKASIVLALAPALAREIAKR